jgi:phospholipid transport system substrate-binding protein
MVKKHKFKRKVKMALPLTLLLILAPLKIAAATPEAVEVVQRFNSALMEAMQKADALKFEGRYRLLRPIVGESFAMLFMAQKSLGKYWKTLTGEQQQKFVKAYTDWSAATYARRFDAYSGERFRILPETMPEEGTATVVSELIKADGEKIDFNYRLRQAGGSWQIVDIQISGVSQLALTRSQFLDVVQQNGFKALMAKLQDKIHVLSIK